MTGLKANTTYYFRVVASDGKILSDHSVFDSATTLANSSNTGTSSSGTPSQSRGTLKIVNNSSHTIKDLTLYTADYDVFSLSGMETVTCTVDKNSTETVSNVCPGTYVEIGSKPYLGYKVKTDKIVVVNSGKTTVLTITDSDIISN